MSLALEIKDLHCSPSSSSESSSSPSSASKSFSSGSLSVFGRKTFSLQDPSFDIYTVNDPAVQAVHVKHKSVLLKSPLGKEVIPSTGAVDTVDAKNTTATEAMTRFL